MGSPIKQSRQKIQAFCRAIYVKRRILFFGSRRPPPRTHQIPAGTAEPAVEGAHKKPQNASHCFHPGPAYVALMKTVPLTIRRCPTEVHQALKSKAKSNRRSLNNEALTWLEKQASNKTAERPLLSPAGKPQKFFAGRGS